MVITLRAQPCPGRVPFIVGVLNCLRSGPQETVEPSISAPRRLDETACYEAAKKPRGCGFASASTNASEFLRRPFIAFCSAIGQAGVLLPSY